MGRRKINGKDLSFRILNKEWKVRVLNKRKYGKKHGKDSVAVALLHKRRIDFSPYGVDLETVMHELMHCYIYEFCVYSSDLTADQLEEFFCELMAKHGYSILDQAHALLAKVKVMKLVLT